MKKIEFVNGTTIDGAKTFNDMQDNVEEAIEINIITGQEIPTNEYIDGNRVYLYRQNLGSLPNNTVNNYSTGLNANYNIVRYNLFANYLNQRLSIPYISLNGLQHMYGYCNDASVIPIKTDADFSAYNLIVEIYYTKQDTSSVSTTSLEE